MSAQISLTFEEAGFDFRRRAVIGTPVTPKNLLASLAGASFCVSFAAPEQLDDVIPLCAETSMLMLDNGAFSIWNAKRRGKKLPKRLQFATLDDYRAAFWQWANAAQARCEQAVAVIPDVIEGSERANLIECSYAVRDGFAEFPERVMPVWHLNESLAQLETFCRLFNFVAFGSCAEYDVQRQPRAYRARIAEASAVIDRVEREHGRRPWIHLMRGLGVLPELIRFESADSTNIAINHCRYRDSHGAERVRFMHSRIRGELSAAEAMADVEECAPVSNFDDAPTRRPR